jgi:hypothetical protein
MGATASIDVSMKKANAITQDQDDHNDGVSISTFKLKPGHHVLSSTTPPSPKTEYTDTRSINEELQLMNIIDNTSARLKLLKSKSNLCIQEWQEQDIEESDIALYTKDLFHECVGEAEAIEMQAFQTLLEEILSQLEVKGKHITPRSRQQLSASLMLVLSEEYTCMRWKDVSLLLSFISVNLENAELLFEE